MAHWGMAEELLKHQSGRGPSNIDFMGQFYGIIILTYFNMCLP